jgi:hypothetical protein
VAGQATAETHKTCRPHLSLQIPEDLTTQCGTRRPLHTKHKMPVCSYDLNSQAGTGAHYWSSILSGSEQSNPERIRSQLAKMGATFIHALDMVFMLTDDFLRCAARSTTRAFGSFTIELVNVIDLVLLASYRLVPMGPSIMVVFPSLCVWSTNSSRPPVGNRRPKGSLPLQMMRTSYVQLEVSTGVTTKNTVCWYLTPCGSCSNRSCGATYRLHHQDGKNQRAENNVCSN